MDALGKRLQSCQKLATALQGVIRLDLQQRHRRLTLDLRIFKAIKIAEFYRMIDDSF